MRERILRRVLFRAASPGFPEQSRQQVLAARLFAEAIALPQPVDLDRHAVACHHRASTAPESADAIARSLTMLAAMGLNFVALRPPPRNVTSPPETVAEKPASSSVRA